jgi:hypothetical protein
MDDVALAWSVLMIDEQGLTIEEVLPSALM